MAINLEQRRQFAHLVLGVMLAFYAYLGYSCLYIIMLGIFSLAVFQINKKLKLPIANFLVEKFEREQQKEKLPGWGFFLLLLGSALIILLFEKQIAAISLLVFGVSDSVATLVGMRYGRTKPRIFEKGKSLEGSLAGLLSSIAVLLFIVKPISAFLASLAGVIAVGIKKRFIGIKIEDNIAVPLAVALTLKLLTVFGI